jgi:hypothetical protein
MDTPIFAHAPTPKRPAFLPSQWIPAKPLDGSHMVYKTEQQL